jgi:cyclic-di-AMP phosphodiesterase PgpH
MSLLSKIFRSSRVRPVGTSLESGRDDDREHPRTNVLVKVALFVVLLAVSLAVFPRGQIYRYTVEVDDIWRQDNLLAPFVFAIKKSPDVLKAQRDSILVNSPRYFVRDPDALVSMRVARDSLSSSLSRLLELYGSFMSNRTRGRVQEAFSDSLAYVGAEHAFPVTLSQSQWDRLLSSYADTVPGLSASSRSVAAVRLDERSIEEVWGTAVQLQRRGVTDLPLDSLTSRELRIRDEETRRERLVLSTEVISFDRAREAAGETFRKLHSEDPDLAAIDQSFFIWMFRPSLIFDRVTTQVGWRAQIDAISPNLSIVRQNEVIIRKGDPVTPLAKLKLLSLEQERNERSGSRIVWQQFFGQLILILSTFLIFFLYLYLLRRPIFDENKLLLLISILFLGILAMYAVALRVALLDMYVVPVAILAISLTIIFDSRVALFGSLTMALVGSHLLNYDFAFLFSTFFACTLGIFSVRDIRNRGQFFLSAGLVFTGYVTVLFASYLLQNKPVDRFTDELIFAGVNSVLLLLAYPMLWVFERAFDLATDLTLLELSDTNRPLLKQLSMEAPGTFNHVMQVANLAEASATVIGANALLTRVGSLYHDVGKMTMPEYFVENQRGESNPHDELKPSMSALIIANHVKEGLEIGRKYRIPQKVLDFIPMHHGTSRIEYFYQKALEQRQPDDPEVNESDFRYPGPKPNTVETSILMLADTVEAAARTLTNPTHKRLEGLIDTLIDAKMEDGQLDESGLTFANLNQIRSVFLKVLLGFYHVRVKYPGAENEDDQLMPPGDNRSDGDLLSEALN